MEFGKIEPVEIKSMWPGEATHFTPWLAENLDTISEKIDMVLELIETEAAAGGFSADIVAKDIATNRTVIIENQFGNTDHKHLGQIITYASLLNASAVIWVAESIRQEHQLAIDFLNQNLKNSFHFFAIEVSLIKIDDSKPAYVFNVVSKPSNQELISTKASTEMTEGKEKYRTYFQSLIDTLRIEHQFTNAKVGQPQNWYTFASENSKIFKYSTSFALGGRVRTEIYIDSGEKESNERLFKCLEDQKSEIESAFGGQLEWEKLENKRACRIATYIDGSIDDDSDSLEIVKVWAIDNLLKLKKVFPKKINECLKNT